MTDFHHGVEIDVWTVDLTATRPDALSAEESARAARFHFESDRVRWSRAHSALRTILAEYTGVASDRLAFELGEHGKPSLRNFPEIHFNLSHAGDYAMIAVSRAVPIGIDIERIREGVDMAALLRRLGEENLPADELGLHQRWTRREAATKASGSPLFARPAEDIWLTQVTAPPGYVACLAVVARPAIGGIIVRSRGPI